MELDDLVVLVIIGVILVNSIGIYCYYTSATVKIVTVKEKWIKASGSSMQIYLFSDTEGNVYCIRDDPLLWKWDASDRWAKLEAGRTYRITFYGWRVHILSLYPNAVNIEEI